MAELIDLTFFSDAEADNSTTVVYFTSLGMSMKAAVTFITVGGSTRNGSELSFGHSKYIRTVSSKHLLSTFLVQFKLVYVQFGKSNMHLTFEISATD